MAIDRISDYLTQFAQTRKDMLDQLRRVIVGQAEVIEQILAAIFTRGHCLLVGVPGLAKTLMVSSISQILDITFKRIQFTPDLMPSDITGTMILDESETGRREFRFVRGPVFANILLADEINRASPKTQSALLEAMQERQVTLAETTFALDDPFWVLATQNPVEQEGVYALPEAQLDRFSMMLRVEYPAAEFEAQMLKVRSAERTVEPRVSPADVTQLRALIRDTVYVDDTLIDYIVRLGRATRRPAEAGRAELADFLVAGISPRSYEHVLALARVTAFMTGRDYVRPSDVKEIFIDATRHRVMRSIRAQAENVEADWLLAELLHAVALP